MESVGHISHPMSRCQESDKDILFILNSPCKIGQYHPYRPIKSDGLMWHARRKGAAVPFMVFRIQLTIQIASFHHVVQSSDRRGNHCLDCVLILHMLWSSQLIPNAIEVTSYMSYIQGLRPFDAFVFLYINCLVYLS